MYQGYFINLDRNAQRRDALVQHLAAVGVAARYQRIAAVDGRAVAHEYPTQLDPGNLGLWLSHLNILAQHGASPKHLHVIEDDAVLARTAAHQFDAMLAQADANAPGWDLIFTDVHVSTGDLELFRLLSHAMRRYEQTGRHTLLDLEQIPFACTSSMFINQRSVAKYQELMSTGWQIGKPIDIYLRDLVHQKRLKAYLTVPFVTSVSRDSLQSDILGTVTGAKAVVTAVVTAYRRAFFQDADLPALDAEIQELTRQLGPPSPLTALYLRTLFFRLSDAWVPY